MCTYYIHHGLPWNAELGIELEINSELVIRESRIQDAKCCTLPSDEPSTVG